MAHIHIINTAIVPTERGTKMTTSDTISTKLDEIAAEIRGAQNVTELHEALMAAEAACANNASRFDPDFEPLDIDDELRRRGIDMTDLPVYGTAEMPHGEDIWSCDDTMVLAGEGAPSTWRTVSREDVPSIWKQPK